MKFQMLAPDEVDQYCGSDTWQIIDLRERSDYEKGHIKNAWNIPYHSENWYKWMEKNVQLWKNKKIILYCERGPTSFAAAKELAEIGISACVVVGGIRAYRSKIKERY